MNQIGITERGDPSLDLGWVDWVKSGSPAILISKNPGRMYVLLHCHAPDANIIVHTTITGYGGTIVEPKVPDINDALGGYKRLVDRYGESRVVLRIDPIIPTEKGTLRAKMVLDAAKKIANTRVRISFLDLYPHVKQRFLNYGIVPPDYNFHADLEVRKSIWRELGEPDVCGEPGFECTGCVSKFDCDVLGVNPEIGDFKQRPACACIANKLELLTSKKQCANGCLYCYWGKK